MPIKDASAGYVTTEQASQILGCHRETVRRMVRDGSLPAVKVGRRDYRIPLAAVEPQVMPEGQFHINGTLSRTNIDIHCVTTAQLSVAFGVSEEKAEEAIYSLARPQPQASWE